MTVLHPPFTRALAGLAGAAACALLAACATKPAPSGSPVANPPSRSAAPAAASPTASRSAPAARSAQAAATPGKARSSRTAKAKAKPKTQPRGAPAWPATGATAAAPKVDRSFLRPADGPVLARFDGRANKGVDFGGAKGDPVRAAGDGQVVFAGATLRGYGRLVMIKHDATYLTAYAHNSELLVKQGQRVKRGQQIARMGDSDAARVKLHFELRRNGGAIDPMPFLAAGAPAAEVGSH